MGSRTDAAWVIAGAAAGSLLVGVFRLQPAWVWGLVGGGGGGATASAARWLLRMPWPLPLRVGAALLALGAGFYGLYLLAGGLWVTDPRSFEVRPPF